MVLVVCTMIVFILQFYFPSSELGEEKEKAAKCYPHPNLKVVEVVGYRAHPPVGELVMHLMKNVAALEKIVIDPIRRWWCPIRSHPNETVRGVEEVKERLYPHIPNYFSHNF